MPKIIERLRSALCERLGRCPVCLKRKTAEYTTKDGKFLHLCDCHLQGIRMQAAAVDFSGLDVDAVRTRALAEEEERELFEPADWMDSYVELDGERKPSA